MISYESDSYWLRQNRRAMAMDLGVIVEISSRDDELLIRGGVNRDLYWTQRLQQNQLLVCLRNPTEINLVSVLSHLSLFPRWRVPRVGSLSSTVLSIYRPVVG
jgi:hypothetical protein